MTIDKEKKEILSQFIFSFRCEKEYINMLLKYEVNINWQKVINRKSTLFKNSKFKSGKSFCPNKRGFIELKEFSQLNKWLEGCFSKVVEDLNWNAFPSKNLKITQSWINKSIKGESHHLHRHSFSILSGILYLSNNSSTQFFIPSIYELPTIISQKKDPDITIKHHYQGKKGELIIFPSALCHCVGPNMYQKPRISLSMNTWPIGDIGFKDSLALIPKEIHN